MRDHEPLTTGEFKGIYDRGDEESTPLGYFISSQNLRFFQGGFTTRFGSSLHLSMPVVKRMAVYKREGEAQRLLVLDDQGQLWDSTNMLLPILSIATMSDFSMVSIFSRAYITPHNGITGLPGEKVYVYEGSGQARPAAGTRPSGFNLTAINSALSGNLEAGTRVFAVAYETGSGFITGYGGYVSLVSTGGKQVTIGNLPIGPSTVVARRLVATKLITGFTGDFVNQTYFFVPNGRIGDNQATGPINFNFFDADLVQDASYLADELEEIPAGVGIGLFNSHMLVYGENLNQAVCRVAKGGEPESMSASEGFVVCNPGDTSGAVNNHAEHRSQLMLFKGKRTYVTRDNGAEAAFWDSPKSIEDSVGTVPHGIVRSLDFGETILDRVLIAARGGLYLYDGTFGLSNILTNNFDDVWGRINKAAFHTLEITADPENFKIYAAVPLDGAITPNCILYGDYEEGLTAENIKWDVWRFPVEPRTIVVDVVSSLSVLRFGSPGGNIYNIDETQLLDFGNAIESWAEFPLIPTGDVDGVVHHYTGIRLRVKGAGNLLITGRGMDSAQTFSSQSISMSVAPGRPIFKGFNFVNERCSIKLRVASANDWFRITKFTLFATPLWEGRVA